MRSHPAITRISLVAIAFVGVASFAQQDATQASPPTIPTAARSILPTGVGRGIGTSQPVVLTFDSAIDPAPADRLRIEPTAAVELAWSDDRRSVTVAPRGRWRTDTRYLISLRAGGSDGAMGQFSFTTQTAPTVLEFLVEPAGTDALTALAGSTALLKEDRSAAGVGAAPTGGPAPATADVSGLTEVSIAFDRPMDRDQVGESFAISPDVEGAVSWSGDRLTFRPLARLQAQARYTVSLVGARDRIGNPVDSDAVFSFSVRPSAQLVKIRPQGNASGVTPDDVSLWFSQPMDRSALGDGFALLDLTTGETVPGTLAWSETSTSVTFTPDAALAAGHRFETRLGSGVADADGHPVAGAWRFTTQGRGGGGARPVLPATPPAADLAGYALNQVNAARAAYGFAPVVIDPAITAVASAHAWDMLNNGYFSHYSLDGRGPGDRLRAGGISFSTFGENICRNQSGNPWGALDYCHAYFMSEPYPGYFNHIANILNPKFTRVGIGIAQGGATITLVWDFAT